MTKDVNVEVMKARLLAWREVNLIVFSAFGLFNFASIFCVYVCHWPASDMPTIFYRWLDFLVLVIGVPVSPLLIVMAHYSVGVFARLPELAPGSSGVRHLETAFLFIFSYAVAVLMGAAMFVIAIGRGDESVDAFFNLTT